MLPPTPPHAPGVPAQRRPRDAAGSVVVDIDAGVLEASRRRPRLSLDDLRDEHVQRLTELLLDARFGDEAIPGTGLRAEALVEHLIRSAGPAALTAHAEAVGRLLRALHPDVRGALLQETGAAGTPMRRLLERCLHAGDPAARAYAG